MQPFVADVQHVSEGIDSMLADVARTARDLQGIFQLHQNVLDRAAESNHLLHSLISQA